MLSSVSIDARNFKPTPNDFEPQTAMTRVELYEHPNYRGRKYVILNNGDRTLQTFNSRGHFRNDRISSAKICIVRHRDQPCVSNGERIKGSGPQVYWIDNGRKRWIPDQTVFNRLFMNWRGIQTRSGVEHIPEGPPVPKYARLVTRITGKTKYRHPVYGGKYLEDSVAASKYWRKDRITADEESQYENNLQIGEFRHIFASWHNNNFHYPGDMEILNAEKIKPRGGCTLFPTGKMYMKIAGP